jgi:hypothetical protein
LVGQRLQLHGDRYPGRSGGAPRSRGPLTGGQAGGGLDLPHLRGGLPQRGDRGVLCLRELIQDTGELVDSAADLRGPVPEPLHSAVEALDALVELRRAFGGSADPAGQLVDPGAGLVDLGGQLVVAVREPGGALVEGAGAGVEFSGLLAQLGDAVVECARAVVELRGTVGGLAQPGAGILHTHEDLVDGLR